MDKRFGLKVNCLKDIVNVLTLQPEVEEAIIFGSRAMGTYKNGSDIDIALKGEKITFDTISTIRLRLDELPYLYMYDIIDYKKISNPAVTTHIDELGITFYKKQMMPSEWKTYKLSDLINLVGGGTPKTTVPEYWNGEIPWLSVVDFGKGIKKVYQTEKSITEKGLNESSTKILKEGQIIISARGTVGELAVLGRDMAFNQSCYGIYANDKTENNFLYYLLKYSIGKIKKNTHGAVFDTITKQTFDNIEVAIPESKTTQRQIAAILSSLDDKIELNLQMNQTLEAMAQAIFKEWFVSNSSVVLSEYIEINPKISIKKDESTIYVEMSDLSEFGSSVKSYVKRAFTSGSKFQNMDTLLARITPCLENGKTALVDFLGETEVAHGSTEFIVMRSKGFISPYYVYLLARDQFFREYAIKSMVGSSGRQRVQHEMLNSYELPEIDENKMMKFHQTVGKFFEKITTNTLQIRTLTQTRDTLLPKLMSGQIAIQV